MAAADRAAFVARVRQNFPPELQATERFVCWRTRKRGGRPTKVPYNARTGKAAKSNDPATWASLDESLGAYYLGTYDGVGFVLTDSGRIGIDLDDCIELDGSLHADAASIVAELPEGYWERSPSGSGVKCWIEGERTWTNCVLGEAAWGGRFEIYGTPTEGDGGRYFCVTGDVL